MIDQPHWALLPAGFHDTLPPDAAHEAATVEHLMQSLTLHGYQRVKPPLLEFEDTLLAGVGAAMAVDTFRLMDPVSQRMMGLRADSTLQIARIAASRLGHVPRPLRLSYAGQVLRVRGSELRPERQFAQVGVELIGADQPAADAEVAVLAARALAAVGVTRLSLDLNVPTLVTALFDAMAVEPADAARLRHALDRKDADRVSAIGGPAAASLAALLRASGPSARALPAMAHLELPAAAQRELDRLVEVVGLVGRALPDLSVTVDLVEHRGFEYHSGVSFTLFAQGIRGELGRGGRYPVGPGPNGDGGEPATGMTLYMDSVLRALPLPAPERRLFLPLSTDRAVGEQHREAGWITVAGLAVGDGPVAEARRLGCTHVWTDGTIVPVAEEHPQP